MIIALQLITMKFVDCRCKALCSGQFTLIIANACSATFICFTILRRDEHDAVERIRLMLVAPNSWLWERGRSCCNIANGHMVRRWHSLGSPSIGICLFACFSACAALSLKIPQDFLVPWISWITADQGSYLLLFDTSSDQHRNSQRGAS